MTCPRKFTRAALNCPGKASAPERLVGFFQRLLPGQAEVIEPMRVVGEIAQRLPLALPRPQAKPSGRPKVDRPSQVLLMKL
jgi:hypothetical protein